MPDTNQQIVLKLVLDGKEFKGNVQIANADIKALRGQSDAMNSSVTQWSIAVTGFNQALQVGQKLASVLSKPIDVAGQFEQYRVSLKVMLGDAKSAEDRLAELSKFAAETPFDLPQVVEAANKLQTINKYSKELLTNLGDLASASGKPFEQAIDAYLKMASGQKGEAMMMFRDLLISNDDWIAATGKGIKANGELEASTQQLLEAIPKIIKNKNFAGMMEEQSKTWKGIVSNLDDEMTRTAGQLGEQFLPAAKEIAGTIIPTLGYLRDHFGEIAPIIGVATAATLLYVNAARVQVIAETLLASATTKGSIIHGIYAAAKNISTIASTAATATTLAYGLMVDVLTNKITLASAVQQMMTLSTMVLGSATMLLAGSLAVLAVGWGVYQMTIAKARNEMADLALKQARVKLGLDDLQARLDTMNFDNLIEGVSEGENALYFLYQKLSNLKKLNGTGVAFLDWAGTGFGLWGNSTEIYNQIAVTKKQIEAQEESNNMLGAHAKKLSMAIDYTSKFDEATFKSLKSISQVKDARDKFTRAKNVAETDKDRESLKKWGDQLEALDKKLSGTRKKPKTYEQEVKDKVKYYEDLVDVDKKYTGSYKKYLDDQINYYTVTLVKRKGSLAKLTTEEVVTLKELTDKKKALETGELNEVNKLRTDSMKAGLDKDAAQIEQWYGEQKELKLYKTNADAKALIDKQYAQKKLDLAEQTETKINQLQIEAMAPGYEKERAQLEEWYRQQKQTDLYKPNSIGKAAIDMQYDERSSELTKKEQKEINDARIEAMEEGHNKELSIIDEWYRTGKENELYKTNVDYKLDIDQQYYNKKLELAKKDLQERNALNGAMLAGYDTFTQNLLNTDMTGAEKRQAIMSSVGNFFYQLLAEQLRKYIITKLAEVTVTGATEATKTGITSMGVGARLALLGTEIVATLAKAAASIVSAAASVIEWEAAMFGPFALATVPASLALMLGIFSGIKSALGFNLGGRLKKGQTGYFEGDHDEIIAPEKTFIQIMKQEIIPQVIKDPSVLPVMSLLQRGRDMISSSVFNARTMSDRQAYSNNSGNGSLQIMTDRLTTVFSDKLDLVIDAFVKKQWAIAGTSLKTVQDNTKLMVEDMRF